MAFDPQLAEIRFGTGLSPKLTPPASIDDMLSRLAGPDHMAARHEVLTFEGRGGKELVKYAQLLRDYRRAKRADAGFKEARAAYADQRRKLRKAGARMVRRELMRGVQTEDGLRERLVWFWSDHFAAASRSRIYNDMMPAYAEQAIRPYVAGPFEDLLWHAITHPVMQTYLDQPRNMGPNSAVARKRPNKGLGLNENLAREVLELHTLGVGGSYGQADVRAFAALLTGLGNKNGVTTVFRPAQAEPGPHHILGQDWGGAPKTREEDLREFVRWLARHPVTLAHLAQKLAVHFVADTPDPDMVQAMGDAMAAADGDLMAGYRAMLEHPSAWAAAQGTVKPPVLFMVSAMRALDIHPAQLERMNERSTQEMFLVPMTLMGQPWHAPLGPDGFPEEDNRWITPQGLAERIQWAMTAPQGLVLNLPDPRDFLQVALGARAPETLRFASGAAETNWEGIGMILSAPAFQRS